MSQGLADKLIEFSSKYPLFLQYACLGFNGELSIPAKIIVKNLNLKQGFLWQTWVWMTKVTTSFQGKMTIYMKIRLILNFRKSYFRTLY